MADGVGERPRYPGTPRWVKVLGVVTLILAVTFAVVHLSGGGFRHHAPFQHDQPTHMHDAH
jgi:hypothetical protein